MSQQPKLQRTRRAAKIRPVPIAQMRVPPALVTQRPFRKGHGDRLASELDLDKLGYPIINHRDGLYWILDGQHRIYALKARGFTDDVVDCEVYDNLTDAEMAEIFLGRDDRRAVDVFSRFHIACTAGRTRECEIQRVVEANGLKVSKTADENCVGSVSAIGKIMDRSGSVVLGQVLRTAKQAFAGDPSGFDAFVLDGLGLVFHRYNGRTNEKDLAERLGHTQHGVKGLLRRAEAQRERTGNQKAQCVAATIVEINNKGTRKNKLPSWWKEA